MSLQKGPLRLSAERLAAARTPPIVKPSLPAEVLQKYRDSAPLRRPPAPPQNLADEPLKLARPTVEQAIAAAKEGNALEVRAEGRDFTLLIVPTAREEIQQSGLSPEELQRLFNRLANALGSAEALAKLPLVQGMPGVREYKTIIGKPGMVYVFRLVLAVLPDSSAAVVVSCSLRRERSA